MTRPARIARHRQAVVVGIHALPFSKNIGMTERRAGGLAILGALADAGLTVADVDAMFRFVWENTTEMEMARILGAVACSHTPTRQTTRMVIRSRTRAPRSSPPRSRWANRCGRAARTFSAPSPWATTSGRA